MPGHFKFMKVIIWLLGAATVIAAYQHGSSCFTDGDAGGIWFAIVAAGALFITYRTFAGKDQPHPGISVFVVCVNIAVFGGLASFAPKQTLYEVDVPQMPQVNPNGEARLIAEEIIFTEGRFKRLEVKIDKQSGQGIYISGSVATEHDLFKLRDRLVSEGVYNVRWNVLIRNVGQTINGYGDQALINRSNDVDD